MTINSLALAQTEHLAAGDKPASVKADEGLTHTDYTRFLNEIFEQPQWRSNADKEMDYVDGNQLDAEILQRMKAIGMPPAIEPLIGPAMDALIGYEAKTRKDYRVTANGQGPEADAVAEAINFKLNEAERHAKADKACADAFKPQAAVGLGWVEVARESNPFLYKYRCEQIHRNEMWWDMLDTSTSPMLPKARYLIRRRWTDLQQAMLKFPDQGDLLTLMGQPGSIGDRYQLTADGGNSTALNNAWASERGWAIEEQEWRDVTRQRVCLFEVWYRKWVMAVILRSPDGRVVEYDAKNPAHVAAVARGFIKPEKVAIPKMRLSMWCGPHKLTDEPSPYPHHHFPYVAFWGKREDRTGVPYGQVRGMIYLQDAVNSLQSKLRWGISSVQTERTKGAFEGTDEQFRRMAARVDADFVLNEAHMAKPGARFEIKRDFQLSNEQFQMLQDARMGIERLGVSASFTGQRGSATSGTQEQTQLEQAVQAIAGLMDNYEQGRAQVGELLVALIIEDMGKEPQEVTIPPSPPLPGKTVQLNQPTRDPISGIPYLTNDVQRTRMKIALEDVPSTPSFRRQQLAAFSEAYKSMPQQIQVAVLPHLMTLMDVPNKEKVIEAVVAASQNQTEEQVQARIDQAVKQALMDAGNHIKERELHGKLLKMAAEVKKINADAGAKFMEMLFAAIQGAEVITAVPQVTPTADVLVDTAMQHAMGIEGGVTIPQPEGQGVQIIKEVKNPDTGIGFTPGAADAPVVGAGDTTPLTPAKPEQPATGFEGPNVGMTTQPADSIGPNQ